MKYIELVEFLERGSISKHLKVLIIKAPLEISLRLLIMLSMDLLLNGTHINKANFFC